MKFCATAGLLLAIVLFCALEGRATPTNLTFIFIISYGRLGFNSSGALPAAEMALEDINSDPSMLPGYNLVYSQVRDSQVHEP